MATVGVIGIGNIGLEVISRLLQDGHNVIGVSRNPDGALTKFNNHAEQSAGSTNLNFTNNYADLKACDYIVSTASREVPEGTKDRNIFLHSSDVSIETARKLNGNVPSHAKVLVITNPVEWQSSLYDKELPNNEVLGVGTTVDTLRQEEWCKIVVHSWINFIAANWHIEGNQKQADTLRKDFLRKPLYKLVAPVIGLHQDHHQICLPPYFHIPDEKLEYAEPYLDLLATFQDDLFNADDRKYGSILQNLVADQGTRLVKKRQQQGFNPPWDCNTPARAAVSIINACESPQSQQIVVTKKLSIEEISNVYIIPEDEVRYTIGPKGNQFLGVVVNTKPEARTSERGTPLEINYEYAALEHGRLPGAQPNAIRLLKKNLEIASGGLQILGLNYQYIR